MGQTTSDHMKIKYECEEPGHEWEELDLVNGFAFAVVIDPADPDGIIAHALGQRFPAVLHWLMDEELQRIVFDADEGAHVIQHLVAELISDPGNGHGDVEHVGPDHVILPSGELTQVGGPTDEQLDAWLVGWFGEAKPGAGHKFNLPFARALMEFGRSFA